MKPCADLRQERSRCPRPGAIGLPECTTRTIAGPAFAPRAEDRPYSRLAERGPGGLRPGHDALGPSRLRAVAAAGRLAAGASSSACTDLPDSSAGGVPKAHGRHRRLLAGRKCRALDGSHVARGRSGLLARHHEWHHRRGHRYAPGHPHGGEPGAGRATGPSMNLISRTSPGASATGEARSSSVSRRRTAGSTGLSAGHGLLRGACHRLARICGAISIGTGCISGSRISPRR